MGGAPRDRLSAAEPPAPPAQLAPRRSWEDLAWEPFDSLVRAQLQEAGSGGTPQALAASAGKASLAEGDSKMVADVRYFAFGEAKEFLGGLTGLTPGGLLARSMEEECRENEGGRWWDEYRYVVDRAAVEDPLDLPSTQKFYQKSSASGRVIVRDEGHAGLTLNDFMATKEAQAAELSLAEVAAVRLYSGPLFAALNNALRQQRVAEWATTIACCYSGVLKLSVLSAPTRVYRGVNERHMQARVPPPRCTPTSPPSWNRRVTAV